MNIYQAALEAKKGATVRDHAGEEYRWEGGALRCVEDGCAPIVMEETLDGWSVMEPSTEPEYEEWPILWDRNGYMWYDERNEEGRGFISDHPHHGISDRYEIIPTRGVRMRLELPTFEEKEKCAKQSYCRPA